MTKEKSSIWGGRFTGSTDVDVQSFTASVSYDRRLYRYDVEGSIAHAQMLASIGVLTEDELLAITTGLQQIAMEIESGHFEWRDELEDVHMNIEHELVNRIGNAGRKLHTARSRNDQVATDIRLFVREMIDHTVEKIAALQSTLLDMAENEAETIMPGYTHLQVAQPVTLGHHLLAWFEMLNRDRQRFIDARKRTNISPLGSAALAGTSFAIDREFTANALNFDAVSQNSIDSVSDRDFAIEFTAHAALTMVHLSRICEELIHWASEAYKFIAIADEFTTGSSIMPQKKNPDIAELVRGKSARTVGNLQSLLMLMKAQPLAYNRDNQEDKEGLFDTIDTLLASLGIMNSMLANIQPDRERMKTAAMSGFSTATDLADYLVRQDIPFREAHEIVGSIVRHCIENGIELNSMSVDDFKQFSSKIDDTVTSVLTVEQSVAARNHVGGTAPERVRLAVEAGRQRLQS